jgi:hypothetical protein
MSNYTKEFKEFAKAALENHKNGLEHGSFVGFGNPNAKILYLANGVDFYVNTAGEFAKERAANAEHWDKMISEDVANRDFKISGTSDGYNNPYGCINKLPVNRGMGKAICNFQRLLLEMDLVDSMVNEPTLLDHMFFTETVLDATRSTANKVALMEQERKDLLDMPFFDSFDVVILAISEELQDLDKEWIYKRFDMDEKHFDMTAPDLTTFKQTLFVFKGKGKKAGKTILHTRRFSGGSSNDFFHQMGRILKGER